MLAESAAEWGDPASLDWLSVEEKRRLESLRFPKRRAEWLAGRLTAKKLLLNSLASLREYEPSELSIENETEGAPCVFVDGHKLNLSLSISHRDRLALCALSEGSSFSIGADIERIEPRVDAFSADFFTGEEQSQFYGASDTERDRLVTLIWSAKEAALKALRKGLRLDTRTVEIHSIAETSGGWGSFSIRSGEAAGNLWRGWWQVRGEYALTLALFGLPEAARNASLVQTGLNPLEGNNRNLPDREWSINSLSD